MPASIYDHIRPEGYFLGFDPDMTSPVVAVINGHKRLCAIFMHKNASQGERKIRSTVLSAVEGVGVVFSRAIQYCDMSNVLRYQREAILATAVEAQELYVGKRRGPGTPNPRDILMLGHVSGAALLACAGSSQKVYFPAPGAWKGQVPKEIAQARYFSSVGLKSGTSKGRTKKYGYPIFEDNQRAEVIGAEELNQGDWADAADAVGLALYAREMWIQGDRRKQRQQA